jgi:hypothetical protein
MTTTIDFRTLPANIPSLCIPRVFSNIDEKRIRKIFDELEMGSIDRLVFVNKTTEKGEKFNRVFIHFKRWLNNKTANIAREKLLSGKEVTIIYDDPWFWKVSAYREESHQEKMRQPEKKKATLKFDDSDDEKSESRPSNSNSSSSQVVDEFGRDIRNRHRVQEQKKIYQDKRRPAQQSKQNGFQRANVLPRPLLERQITFGQNEAPLSDKLMEEMKILSGGDRYSDTFETEGGLVSLSYPEVAAIPKRRTIKTQYVKKPKSLVIDPEQEEEASSSAKNGLEEGEIEE